MAFYKRFFKRVDVIVYSFFVILLILLNDFFFIVEKKMSRKWFSPNDENHYQPL